MPVVERILEEVITRAVSLAIGELSEALRDPDDLTEAADVAALRIRAQARLEARRRKAEKE